jgi:hypothetical protein
VLAELLRRCGANRSEHRADRPAPYGATVRLTVATLLWQLRQAEEYEAAQAAWQTEGYVFTMEDGRGLDPAYVTRLFQRLRKGPRDELSKLLGHASISITADVYGHLVGTVASDAVNGAASLIAHTVHTPNGVSA